MGPYVDARRQSRCPLSRTFFFEILFIPFQLAYRRLCRRILALITRPCRDRFVSAAIWGMGALNRLRPDEIPELRNSISDTSAMNDLILREITKSD